MSEPRRQAALQEATAARWYGFHSAYRRDDHFDGTLAAVCAAAVAADGYDDASIDVFTGDGDYLTVSGSARSRATLDIVHAVVVGHPRRRFHSLTDFPATVDDTTPGSAPRPGAWAGATLLTPNGAALGSLDLWSAAPLAHGAKIHALLPLLARAVMQVFDERRRIFTGRAVPAPGPRPVLDRSPGPATPPFAADDQRGQHLR